MKMSPIPLFFLSAASHCTFKEPMIPNHHSSACTRRRPTTLKRLQARTTSPIDRLGNEMSWDTSGGAVGRGSQGLRERLGGGRARE